MDYTTTAGSNVYVEFRPRFITVTGWRAWIICAALRILRVR